MAYHDALFQLGMDLTRSSLAQKEDLRAPLTRARATLEDTAVERGAMPAETGERTATPPARRRTVRKAKAKAAA